MTVTSGNSFSCADSAREKSSSTARAPPQTPGASVRAQTASSGILRASASRKANLTAASDAAEPSAPSTTGRGERLCRGPPRTTTTGPRA
jgi:hypothetical protein